MSRSDTETSGTTTAWLLILSIVFNLALAGVAVKWFAKPHAPSPALANRVAVLTIETQLITVAEPPASSIHRTNSFHWRQLESTNYEEYAANLRAIGCPDKTVRDIVIADVDRDFAARERATIQPLPFWTGGRKLKEAERARMARVEALEKEKVSLIRRLLGDESYVDRDELKLNHFEEQALSRFMLGPMEEEKFRRALKLGNHYETLKNDLNTRTGGILTDADEAELRSLTAGLKRELQAVLSPLQWEEMSARVSAMELFKNDFSQAVELAPAEARQIALLWSASGEAFGFFGESSHGTDEEEELRERQFTNSVARLLGEARFAEYQRAQDYDYQQLHEIAGENHLPKEIAVNVYEMRQLAAEEVGRLRNNASLNEPARQERFNQMQRELQKAVSDALGAPAYQDYLRHNGSWITNLNRL